MPRKFKKSKVSICVFCEGESEQAYRTFIILATSHRFARGSQNWHQGSPLRKGWEYVKTQRPEPFRQRLHNGPDKKRVRCALYPGHALVVQRVWLHLWEDYILL